MARHTAKSHKIRKVEILVIQIGIDILANLFYKGNICFGNLENEPFGFVTEVHIDGK